MSRQAVREKIRIELGKWANLNNNKFYDTIDQVNNIQEDQWFTAEYFADFTEKLCFQAKRMKETGSVDITVFVLAGSGYDEAVKICDALQDYMFGLDMGDLTITNTISASEINAGEASGRYYGCVINLNYDFYYDN